MYFRVGVTPADRDPQTAPSNHSDYFYVDEKAILDRAARDDPGGCRLPVAASVTGSDAPAGAIGRGGAAGVNVGT